MTLYEYTKKQEDRIKTFHAYWVKNWRKNPEEFPLEMEEENEGLWDEMFDIFEMEK